MSSIQSHRDLLVWQKSMQVVVTSYQITKHFPDEERFGLVSQIRRAAVSVPSNIAEGKARGFTKAYLNHLSMAAGSVAELGTQFELAHQLKFIDINTKNDIQKIHCEKSGECYLDLGIHSVKCLNPKSNILNPRVI